MALEHLLNFRLVEIGKIKIGCLADKPRNTAGGGVWYPPVALDHFVITTLNRDQSEKLIADAELMESLKPWADKTDGKLRRLPVTFLSNNLKDIMVANYVAYAGKVCQARSDGVTLTEYADGPKGRLLDRPRELPHTPENMARWQGAMKLSTTLNAVVQAPATRWGGVYKFRTTSQITAQQLYSTLKQLQAQTAGVLRGLPFNLVIRPIQVAPKQQVKTVHVVHVELAATQLMDVLNAARAQMQFEIDNAKEMRALQTQYKQLLAHDAGMDDEDLSLLAPGDGEDVVPDAEFNVKGESDPQANLIEAVANDGAELNRLSAKKGMTAADCRKWINEQFKTAHKSGAKLHDIDERHRKALVAKLMEMPDQPLPENF
jgi:hypothetical protein